MLVNFVIYLDVINLLNISVEHLPFTYLCANFGRIGGKKSKRPRRRENTFSSGLPRTQTDIPAKATNIMSAAT
jgi:hypothetical protein